MEPSVVDQILQPGVFFVPPPGSVRVQRSPREWRVFLDSTACPADRPIIEIRFDPAGEVFRVTRNIKMRSDWMSEEVGTAPADRPAALERCIGFALTGTSRLAITSIETPHPVFTLGLLAYLPPRSDPSLLDHARALEARLQSNQPVDPPHDLLAVGRVLFNHLALSPWTSLADNFIALILRSPRRDALDLLGYMLRHLARHLNAFDLVKFHNLGANYPDALMLDAALRAFVTLLDDDATQLDRRALRMGWLSRKRLEGLRVPDRPTSPGENAREFPHPQLPQAQITEPAARTKRLFTDQPAEAILTPMARRLWQRSIDELSIDEELREMGTATFLDRPLGVFGKRDNQSDRTPLLSYEACSPRLIRAALRDVGAADRPIPQLAGFPVARLRGHARQGVVALEDAKKVALDFVFTRTTRSSRDALLRQYDFAALNAAAPHAYHALAAEPVLLIRTGRRELTALNRAMSPLFQVTADEPVRYVECGGVEYLEGLCAIVDGRRIYLPPRWGC